MTFLTSRIHRRTLAMNEFSWPVRVYYEDTDAAGVVYHSNYLKFMERARTEWLRAIGFSQHEMRRETGGIIVISDLEMKFSRPAKLDDELLVNCKLVMLGGASFVVDHLVLRNEEPLCEARVKGVFLDAETFRPRRFPAELKSELSL